MDIYEEKDEGKEATPCCPLDFEIAFQFSVEPTFAKLNHKQDLRIHLKQAFLVLVIPTLLQLSLSLQICFVSHLRSVTVVYQIKSSEGQNFPFLKDFF